MNSILESSAKMAKKPASKNYFTQETEDAIVLYNNTIDPVLRSKIYEEKNSLCLLQINPEYNSYV
jgi:hypothetical protein